MNAVRPAAAVITTGTRLVWDGEAWTVTGIEAGRLMLRSTRGKTLLADTATVLADPSTRLPAAGDGPAACGPLTPTDKAAVERFCRTLVAMRRGPLAVRGR